ncbi:MAG: alpha/beta fold hydrolase [Eggerthellaceae bacterium]|nr:alpha/beta fold hydrolase [Eggerthellaceae bacterium]
MGCSINRPADVVLLHGFAQSAATWDKVAAALSRSTTRTVHVYEFPGHGRAACPLDAQGYSMEAVCAGLLEYLASFETAPAVVGYSMGGRIAVSALCGWMRMQGFAQARIPVSALILESAGLGPANRAEREAVEKRNAEWAERLRNQGLSSFMDYWESLSLFASQQLLPEEERRGIRRRRMENDAEALARTLEGTGAHRMPCRSRVEAGLAMLLEREVPLLYLAGELDGKYAGEARRMGELFSGSAFASSIVFPECGHNVHEERPAAYVEKVASWLNGL